MIIATIILSKVNCKMYLHKLKMCSFNSSGSYYWLLGGWYFCVYDDTFKMDLLLFSFTPQYNVVRYHKLHVFCYKYFKNDTSFSPSYCCSIIVLFFACNFKKKLQARISKEKYSDTSISKYHNPNKQVDFLFITIITNVQSSETTGHPVYTNKLDHLNRCQI